MKATIGIVHGENVNGWFFHSMLGVKHVVFKDGHELADTMCVKSGPLLSAGRGRLMGVFLEHSDADALIMLDSDMVFPPERIWQMIDLFARCRADHPTMGMLGGIAFISGDPRCATPLPNMWQPGQRLGQFIQMVTYPENALVEVGATGAACLIIAREVLEKFAGEKINPFHHIPLLDWGMLARNVQGLDSRDQIADELRYATWGADQCGEDVSFCMRVREAGYRIFVHTGLRFDHAKSTLLGEQEYLRALEAENAR